MERSHAIIMAAVAFVLALLVGVCGVLASNIDTDGATSAALKSALGENRLLKKINQLQQQELDEIKAVLGPRTVEAATPSP